MSQSVEDIEAAAYVLKVGQRAYWLSRTLSQLTAMSLAHPGDFHLPDICWQGKTVVDTCLPFGLLLLFQI